MKNLIKMLAFLIILGGIGTTTIQAQNYNTAVGIRGLYSGFGLTGKKFINETAAIEVILGSGYRSFGAFTITGLYEIHHDLSNVTEGLQYYYGGGLSYTTYRGNYNYFGLRAVGGLEYKVEGHPVTLSFDIMPSFYFGWSHQSYANGGLSARYILGDKSE